MTPASEKYTEAEHEADTIPSGVVSVPPLPPLPTIDIPPAELREVWPRRRLAKWGAAAVVAMVVLALCIATTVGFLVDLAMLGAPGYAACIVASSAMLGASVTSLLWAVRRMR